MAFKKKIKRYFIPHVVLCIIIAVLISITVASDATNDPPTTDDYEYFVMGYNIQEYGTFSINDSDIENPEPSAYREPGYPLYLALCMKLSPRLNSMKLNEILDNGLKTLRYLQIPLIIIPAFLAMYISYLFTKNFLLAYLVLLLTGFSEVMNVISNHLLSENLSALFILLVALFLYQIYRTKKVIYFIFLGISLAILTLIKAIFMYFLIILLIVFIILLFKYARQYRKKFITGILLFIVIYAAITGGWMYRNHTHFNQWTLTNKGGLVLYYRSKLNSMDLKEFMASFILWLPGKAVKDSILERFFEEEEYYRLVRQNEYSYLSLARKELQELVDSYIKEGYEEQEAILLADRDLQKIALKNILKNPMRHILITLPSAWKGLWIETGYKLLLFKENILFIEFRSALFIPIILFACFFAVTIWVIGKKKWDLLLFFSPAIYLYLIDSFITHGKERYSYPLIPILNISLVLIIIFIMNRINAKKSLKIN